MQEYLNRQTLKVVDDETSLQLFLNEAGSFSSFAFDLEFDRDRHSYGFDLCLIQIATTDACYIIDPVGIPNLQDLFDVFQNPAIRKLVHCPGEDLRLLHSLGCYPKNLADTEVMAKLLNYEHTSLAKLLEANCGVFLNKKMQQSNWHTRPLSEEQILYAKDDVVFLHDLFDILWDEICTAKKQDWVLQEFDKLQTVIYTLEKKTNYLKPGDLKALSPFHQFVLNEMFLLRDEIAFKKNKPAYMIMPEDSVRMLASQNQDWMDHQLPSGLHPSLRHGNALDELKFNVRKIFNTASEKNLSKYSEREKFTQEEKNAYYYRKNKQIDLKETIFFPIQKKLMETHGEFAARFILSNAWINKFLNSEASLQSLQPAYKFELLKEGCRTFNVDFEDIIKFEEEFGTSEEVKINS